MVESHLTVAWLETWPRRTESDADRQERVPPYSGFVTVLVPGVDC
ncbi:hypothetical protein SAMN05443574_11366 [Haloarcula vallismortis]|uniref:Uncharacterized protein n=1 Tax=Haloarcula vallismortis TaxID=28442 RepID=A0A1H2YPS4_HALVA|nr:hypothetical protein SAMN05443574_11366 [Haloarcula vallismortis]